MIVFQIYFTVLIAMYVILRLTMPSEEKSEDVMFAIFWPISFPLLALILTAEGIQYIGDLIVNEIRSWRG